MKAEESKLTIKYSEVLFSLYMGLLLFAKGIGLYDGQNLFKIFLVLGVASVMMKLAIERYSRSQLIWTLLLLITGTLSYLISGEKGLLLNFLMAAGMLHVDEKRIIRFTYAVWGTAFIGRVLVSLLQGNGSVYKVHEKMGLGHFFRWGLGYSHPNVLHISYLILAALVLLVLGNQCRVKHLLILFLMNCFVFLFSVSYTGMLIVCILLAGRAYLMLRKQLAVWEKAVCLLAVPICAAGSILLPLVTSGALFDTLNRMLNTRMKLAKHFLQPENIHLFGTRLSDVVTNQLTMDNAYVYAFVTYGIIPFCLIIGLTVYAIYRLLKKDCYVEALVILALAVAGLTEPFLYNLSFKNIGFLFIGQELLAPGNGREILGPLYRLNGDIRVNESWLHRCKDTVLGIFYLTKKKLLIALGTALVITGLTAAYVTYPSGYVVRRSNCEDIPKIFRYYGNESGQDDFLEMEDFAVGDQVEYFGGNIVRIEQVRGIIKTFVIGFYGIVLLYGIGAMYMTRKEP